MSNRLLVLSILILTSLSTFAQNGKVTSTWNYLNLYAEGDGPANLEKAKEAIDEAAQNEATMNNSKTWWYRAQVYQSLFTDTVEKKKFPDAGMEAVASYKRISTMDDPKFKEWDDIETKLNILNILMFNEGISRFQKQDFANAYNHFLAVLDIKTIVERKGKTLLQDLSNDALINASIAAENAGNLDNAIAIDKQVIVRKPEAKAYLQLAKLLKKAKKEDEAKTLLDEGIAKFPKSIDLIIEKLNYYIAENKHDQAIGMIKTAIDLDPKNAQLYYALGTAYDKTGNEEEAKKAYEKAIEINPKDFNSLYNLGAMYYNKAGKMNEEMNKLGMTKEDTKKFEEMKVKRNELFNIAKPYFTKALEIVPNDAQTKQALTKIDLLVGSK